MAVLTLRERKKEATKANILRAAVELIKEKGFTDATMQHIALKADVALRTLYNYFTSKESMVATYMRETVAREEARNWEGIIKLGSTYERMLLLCQKSADWIVKNPEMAEIYSLDSRKYFFAPETEDLPRSGLEDIVTELLALGQQLGDVSSEVSLEVMTRQFLSFFHFSCLFWFSNPNRDLHVIFQESLALFFNGIGARAVKGEKLIMDMLF